MVYWVGGVLDGGGKYSRGGELVFVVGGIGGPGFSERL